MAVFTTKTETPPKGREEFCDKADEPTGVGLMKFLNLGKTDF